MRLRPYLLAASLVLAFGCSGGTKSQTTVVLQILKGNAPSGIDRIDVIVETDQSTFTVALHKKTTDAEFALPFGTRISVPDGAMGRVSPRAVVKSTASACSGLPVGATESGSATAQRSTSAAARGSAKARSARSISPADRARWAS